MTRRMMAAVSLAVIGGCGPALPGSELLGSWTADIRPSLTASESSQYASFTLRATFDANNTYALEARATSTATATNGPGCTVVLVSTGGTWSVSSMNGVNTITTAGTITGTTERTGCRNATENFARRPATDVETIRLTSGNYSVTGGSLVYTATGGSRSLTFTRG
ncbi:MAG: hypothetical protein JNK05_20815 [Myxococcales bacterium]|nr:hypothetical protein [Myxococcales bacterium]